MATGMNTDYPVVPIRRYLDAVEDLAVPSRRTQGTGRAYTRPLLSPFEQLPLEIRQEIYGWLGFPIGGKVWEPIATKQGGMCVRTTLQCILFPRWDLFPEGFYDITHATTRLPIQSRWNCVEELFGWWSGLLFVSKGIRRELWDTIFHSIDVVFGFQVSSKAVHFSVPQQGHRYGNDRPKGFYRMHLKDEQFANLTKVTLTEKCGHTYSTDNPHRMAKVSPRSILVRQAHSVRYIADHCPFLTQFRIQPYLQGSVTWSSRKRRGLRGVAPKSTEALIQAIVYLVERCEHLEIICIRYVIEVHETEDCYLDQRLCQEYFSSSCKCREQDCEFLVPELGYLERLECAEKWARYYLDWLRQDKPEWELA